jgi:hypothetical protein
VIEDAFKNVKRENITPKPFNMAEVEHNAGRNQGALSSRKQHGVFYPSTPQEPNPFS